MVGSNPFATRFTSPGRLPALDAAGRPIDLDGLIDRLLRMRFAAIIGPHGSGKSTVLANIVAILHERGALVRSIRLRSLRDASLLVRTVAAAGTDATVAVDSWECLGAAAGWIVRGLAWMRGCRLVVTSHQGAAGFQVLTDCRPTLAVLEALVSHLPAMAEWYGPIIDAADLKAVFARQHGDIREIFFDLYDRFEARRHERATVRL